MKKIKLNKYSDLEKLKELNENEFIVSLEECENKQRIRIMDFISGIAFLNGSIKKLNKDEFQIKIGG